MTTTCAAQTDESKRFRTSCERHVQTICDNGNKDDEDVSQISRSRSSSSCSRQQSKRTSMHLHAASRAAGNRWLARAGRKRAPAAAAAAAGPQLRECSAAKTLEGDPGVHGAQRLIDDGDRLLSQVANNDCPYATPSRFAYCDEENNETQEVQQTEEQRKHSKQPLNNSFRESATHTKRYTHQIHQTTEVDTEAESPDDHRINNKLGGNGSASGCRLQAAHRSQRCATGMSSGRSGISAKRPIGAVLKTMVVLLLLFVLAYVSRSGNVVVSVMAEATVAASAASGLPKATDGRAINRTTAVLQQQQQQLQQQSLGNLVAIGAISMLDRPTGGASRLIDRIATASNDQQPFVPGSYNSNPFTPGDSLPPAHRPPPATKLDYIIEFMRSNRLERFCDLLTKSDPQITALIDKLNRMGQFTLFVPTNEAILLMPSDQWQSIRSNSTESLNFLKAHTTDELVVPATGTTESHSRNFRPTPHQSSAVVYAEDLLADGARAQLHSATSGRLPPQLGDRHLPMPITSTYYTLDGLPLQVTTAPNQNMLADQPAANLTTSRYELFVNGAKVINGNSQALQEPNNTAITYAIVHLIDRPLYPPAEANLYELLSQKAPRLTRYLKLANDTVLRERLLSAKQMTTVFAPNDNAFKALPDKFVQELESNRTFLQHFVRSHFVPGLYHSAQLTPLAADQQSSNKQKKRNLLSSMGDNELEFDTKTLQSRGLILVNSIPIVESDVVASNGLVHLTTRPIVERHLLEQCNCGESSPFGGDGSSLDALDRAAMYAKLWPAGQPDGVASDRSSNNNNSNYLFDGNRHANVLTDQLPPTRGVGSNWFARTSSASTGTAPRDSLQPLASNELEREESQISSQSVDQQVQEANPAAKRGRAHRQQRSGSLASNRDFYRPSTAPANLLLTDHQQVQSAPGAESSNIERMMSDATSSSASSASSDPIEKSRKESPVDWNRPLSADLFEVERYKVVLNATSREKLRAEQQQQQQSNNSAVARPMASPHFVYDKPLGSSTQSPSSTDSNKRLYATLLADPNNNTAATAGAGEQSPASSNRNQRLLKFRPEDARDVRPMSADRDHAYELLSARSDPNGAKLLVPSPGFSGCAFYDADCKRLVGKLVRLPSSGNKQAPRKQITAGTDMLQSQTGKQQRVDTSFGEASSTPETLFDPNSALRGATKQLPSAANHRPPVSTVVTGASSPLNHPLTPWAGDEPSFKAKGSALPASVKSSRLEVGASVPSAAGTDTDISRITFAGSKSSPSIGSKQVLSSPSFTRTSSPQPSSTPTATRTTAQVLLVPVKVLQDAGVSFATPPTLSSSVSKLSNFSMFDDRQTVHFANKNANSKANPHPQRLARPNPSSSFNNFQGFHTPTSRPTAGGLDSAHSSDRLSNFTTTDTWPETDQPATSIASHTPTKPSSPQRHRHHSNQLLIAGQVLGPPRSPVAFRKERPAQIQIDNNGTFGANFDLNPANGIKQARKMMRLQTDQQAHLGDISVTSAKLVSRPLSSNLTSGGLSISASNQQPDIAGNQHFTRSVIPSSDQIAADYFQNRTIAEIMDDSGLRIDGQQVTFVRLKECLAEADLLNLVTQADQALTIFMPTDTAFMRLVQAQVQMHQRERQSRPGTTLSARLIDPTRKHLLPLVGRQTRTPDGLNDVLSNDPLGRLQDPSTTTATTTFLHEPSLLSSSNNVANRLTLDCSSNQVKQLLLDHISARLIAPRQLLTDTSLSALSGKQLLMSSVPSKKIVVVDGQPVIAATRAKNGMVYVVNKFLNLTQQVPNVVDLIETQPNMTTFLSYLSFSSLTDRLKRETGPITVMAPTNEAFNQLSTAARHLINSDPAALADILRGHVVEGAQFGKLISMRNKLKTMNADQYIEARVLKPNLYQLDNQVTAIRLVGTTANGVLNSIDRLIVPAWLRVSMGEPTMLDALSPTPKPLRSDPINNGFFDTVGSAGSPNDIENALASNGNVVGARAQALSRNPNSIASSGMNNLPLLNTQPLRFEQPDARLTSPNSILLLNPSNGNSTFDTLRTTSISNNSSPFLRVADNLTSSPFGDLEPLAGDRLRSAANGGGTRTNSMASSGSSAGRPISKNMQLIQKLANLMDARKFVRYLLRARLSESLKPDMNYVILVPTDQAVDRLPKQIIDLLERDNERLTDLVNYHVLDTTFEYINTIPDGSTLNTLNEKDILFDWHRNNTILTASGAVVLGGIQEDNIALLIVDRVLYPTPGDLLSIVSKSPILSNFTQIIRNAGLEQQLSLNGPYTLFAPSDFAFNQLDQRQLDFLQRNKDTARRFLLRHLSQPAIFTSSIALASPSVTKPITSSATHSSLLSSSSPVPSLTMSNSLGEDLVLRQRNDYFSVNDVNFSYADVAATNGVIHVIDGLL